MMYSEKVYEASFVKRLNRFEALVMFRNTETLVHVPNTGRCKELLREGVKVIIEDRESIKRKTKYELVSVYKGDKLVSIESQLPNKLVKEAIKNGIIEELNEYKYIKSEVTYNNSRLDLLLKKNEDSIQKKDCCFVEIKGVTLEKNGVAMFPDAPTARGTKHVNELIRAYKEGYNAVTIFVIQLGFSNIFVPNKEMDLMFYESLKKAEKEGVRILAYDCTVGDREIAINKRVNVEIQ